MAHIFATFLFLLAAFTAMGVIVAGLISDWALVMHVLGIGGRERLAPLPPEARVVALRPAAVLEFTPRPHDLRVAA